MSDKQLEINDLPEDARALSGEEMKGVQGGLGTLGGVAAGDVSGDGLLGGSLLGAKGDRPPKTQTTSPCSHDPNKLCCY